MDGMTDTNLAIEVAGLTKSYGDHPVLDGVDLTVPEGTVYALLGPNGAGKTTIVNILSTLLAPGAGELRVAGFDVRREPAGVRTAIGVTGQFSAIDELLTGRENLRLMADLAHLHRATATTTMTGLLERFELVDAADRRAQTYSGGMKRRLDLAMTLLARPRLIFLDEPTTGLDPRSRREVWAIVRELVADGVTVLLTTQYLDEADQLADRIGVLDGGRLVAEGTAAQLKRRVPGNFVSVQFTDAAALAAAAAAHPTATTNTESLTLQLRGDGSITGLRRVLDGLDDRGVAGLTVASADLDDVFLALTGRSAEAPAPEEVAA
jgi:ABC-2 type transport system ATP-binding protein